MQLGSRSFESGVSLGLPNALLVAAGAGNWLSPALGHTHPVRGEYEGTASLLHILPSGVAGGIVGQKSKHE